MDYYIIHRANTIHYLRAKGAVVGQGCDIIAGVHSLGTEPYLVRLGDNVTIAGGAILITHDGATRVFRKLDPDWKTGMGLYGVIEIENNVFIGANSIILPDIHIGSNVIIGAGSVVTRDIASGSIVAGNPARMIGTVNEYKEKARIKAIDLPKWDDRSKRELLTTVFWKK